MGEQVPRGFWVAAREEPERVALIDADGRAWTAGELLAGANRLVHALRARGCAAVRPGRDAHPQLGRALPDAARGLPGRLAVRAAQHPPHRRRGRATSSATPAPTALVRRRATSPTSRAAAADDRRGPAGGRIAVGGAIPGFTSLRRRARRPARRRRPTDRVAGQFMQYTSGTTGRPKAVQRDLPRSTPRPGSRLYSANLTRYDIEPGGDAVHLVTSPMYHLSPLVVRLLLAAPRAHRRAHGEVGRRARAAADRRGTASPTSRWCPRSSTG